MDNGESSYRRFLSGDDTGMEELVRDYKDGLILYLNSYTGSISTSEDLVQDTFIRLAVKRPKFSGKCSFKTWLYTIARNIAIDFLRKQKRQGIPSADECDGMADLTNIEREHLAQERRITLHRAMSRLKNEYSQVLYLLYFEGFDISEAAMIMKKSKKQTENLLYNAKRSLRSELERDGFVYEEL